MTDIAERLRDWQDYEPVKMFCAEMLADLEEAAAEIERLREGRDTMGNLWAKETAENSQLRTALRKITDLTMDALVN